MRLVTVLAVFGAGIAVALIGSVYAVGPDTGTVVLSAAENGAWLLTDHGDGDARLEFCWVETAHPSIEKVIKCAVRVPVKAP